VQQHVESEYDRFEAGTCSYVQVLPLFKLLWVSCPSVAYVSVLHRQGDALKDCIGSIPFPEPVKTKTRGQIPNGNP